MAIGICYIKIGQIDSGLKEFDNVLAIMKKHENLAEKGIIFKKMTTSVNEILENETSKHSKTHTAIYSLIEKYDLSKEVEWSQIC